MNQRYKVRKRAIRVPGGPIYSIIDTKSAKLVREDYPHLTNAEFKELEQCCQDVADVFTRKDALIISMALNKIRH